MNALLQMKVMNRHQKSEQDQKDALADAMQRFENFYRYCEQSANTKCGLVAEIPEREAGPLKLKPAW